MKVRELVPLICNNAIINIYEKYGTNLYLSQCSKEYNQSKIEDYFNRDIAKIEIANSAYDYYDGIICIFVEDEKPSIKHNVFSKTFTLDKETAEKLANL